MKQCILYREAVHIRIQETVVNRKRVSHPLLHKKRAVFLCQLYTGILNFLRVFIEVGHLYFYLPKIFRIGYVEVFIERSFVFCKSV